MRYSLLCSTEGTDGSTPQVACPTHPSGDTRRRATVEVTVRTRRESWTTGPGESYFSASASNSSLASHLHRPGTSRFQADSYPPGTGVYSHSRELHLEIICGALLSSALYAHAGRPPNCTAADQPWACIFKSLGCRLAPSEPLLWRKKKKTFLFLFGNKRAGNLLGYMATLKGIIQNVKCSGLFFS